MPTFFYKAISKDGKRSEGELKVQGKDEVIQYLERQGLLSISVKEKKDKKIGGGGGGGGLSLVDRHILFSNFALMLDAGLSGFEAVGVLKDDARKKSVKNITSHIGLALEQGRPLSDGFAEFPQYFSAVTINLLKAGEASGNLSKTAKLTAMQYKKENDTKKKVTGAMIYPAILAIGSSVMVFGMLVFIVPRLAKIFEDSNAPLHPITKVTLALSHALSNIFIDFIGIAVGIGIFIFLFRTKIGKRIVSTIFSRLPLIKGAYRDLNLYRFCWTLGALIGSGVNILEAIQITSDVLTGTSYKAAGIRIKGLVAQGFTLGQSLEKEKALFPAIVSSMAIVGEKTGNFEKIFLQLGDFFEERFDTGLSVAIALFEPMLLMVMGLVVGTIAISVILPIYSLVSGVS